MIHRDLHTIFQLEPDSSLSPVIVYSPKESVRLTYVCDFIFKHALNINYKLVTKKEDLPTVGVACVNYSNESLSGALHVRPSSLLFETDVRQDLVPEGFAVNGTWHVFKSGDADDLGYDLFASVFYFISLYQEWQGFMPDTHGRFELKESIQYKHQQHLRPLLNLWIHEFKQRLLQTFPNLKFPERAFKYVSSIDVDNLYAFKHKGIARTLGAMFKDLLKVDLANFKRRCSVVFGSEKDPFDVYDQLIDLSKKHKVPLFLFFLMRDDTKFDRTVNPRSNAFEKVFAKLKNAGISYGLHPSYYTLTDESILRREMSCINEHGIVQISRQHYLRFDVRTTPNMLIKNGVVADFSIGFASGAGYKAATYTPFYFFDLKTNSIKDLLMVPFAVMDGVYFVYSKTDPERSEQEILRMAEEVRLLGGTFMSVFHERTFDDRLYPGYGQVYKNLHEKLSSRS